MLHWALAASAAAFVLNLLLRGLLRVPGVTATLLAAGLVAIGVSLLFAWRYRRVPEPAERIRLLLFYTAIMLFLYAALFGLMLLKDEPGSMGQLLFLLHCLSYPLALGLCFTPRFIGRLVKPPR
ncbi:hypothetical protein [Pseudomonas sp. N040]|uniref:hypothetical protein n=1 Tax=Pseudomonas sp. N040 TaxID=2785325 RepID=UPI001E5D5A41|nr:hypothetical protein [Pseudomonas sp. N040]